MGSRRNKARLKEILGTVAPMLGTALGGPLGGIAGKVLQDTLGVDSDDLALQKIETDPESLVKLKQAEMDFEKSMEELGIQREQLEQADRASARELAIKTSIIPQITLSVIFVLGYFGVLGLFFSQTLATPESDAFVLMLGVLTAGVPQVMSFWLGSSSGSKSKTDALSQSLLGK